MNGYICTVLDANQQCTQWDPVGLTGLTVEQLGGLSAAILLAFAVAFGFRILLRYLLNR